MVAVLDLNPETAKGVGRLLYKTFGYTHSSDWLYDPEALCRKVGQGDLRCAIVGDDDGRVVGFFDIQFFRGGREVADLGVLVIDPDLAEVTHLIALNTVLRETLRQIGDAIRNHGLRLFISTDTTDHTLTQRLSGRFGLTPSGLVFATVPAGGHRFRGAYRPAGTVADRVGAGSGHRRAETLSVYPAKQVLEPYRTPLNPRYRDLTVPVYDALDLPVTFVDPQPVADLTAAVDTANVHRGIATVEVARVGVDAAETVLKRVDHYRAGGMPVVHVLVPQGPEDPDPLFAALERAGAVFGALLPRYKGRDAILMQVVDAIDPALTADRLHHAAARRVLAHALARRAASSTTTTADSNGLSVAMRDA